MRRRLVHLLLLATVTLRLQGAVPPAAQVFPQDTVALVSVPDWQKAVAALRESSAGHLWADPAMQTFRQKFEQQLREKLVADLEKQLGVKLADYEALAQGQVSLGVFRSDPPKPGRQYDWTILIDAREKSEELQKLLVETRTKLAASSKTLRSEKIREQEFTTVAVDSAELGKLTQLLGVPPDRTQEKTRQEITFGQVNTALLFGSSPKSLEKLVTKLTGGLVPPLGELPSYATHEAMFHGAQATAWLDFPAFLEIASQAIALKFGTLASLGADPRKVPGALGIDALQSIGFTAHASDGRLLQLVLRVPEARRTGLFKLIQHEPKDSGMPPFVPGDAVKFSRWRLNGPKMWQSIEETLGRIAPQIVGVLQMALETAGEAQGQKLNLRQTLLETLGDDLITWEKAPKGTTPAELESAPSITLIGSPDGEGLIAGLRALMQLAPNGADNIKTREFLGRKIHTVKLSGLDGLEHSLNLVASGGYVALSDQAGILEEYLRSADSPGKPLREFPGLAEAAQKIGGFGLGMFDFENEVETARAKWEAARQSGGAGSPPTISSPIFEVIEKLKSLADFSLLPPFEKVARYYGFSVETFAQDPQGFHLKVYSPAPR